MSKAKPTSPKSDSDAPSTTIDDGVLRFRINGADGKALVFQIDVLEAKFMCEALESQHKLEANANGLLVANQGFLRDLAAQIGERAGGEVSASVAYQVWLTVGVRLADLQKKIFATPN